MIGPKANMSGNLWSQFSSPLVQDSWHLPGENLQHLYFQTGNPDGEAI